PPAIRDDEKDRLLRRSEHNARAREHKGKVDGHNESERIKKRDAFRREDSMARRTFLTSLREREERWVYKTQASPFHEDLWATDDRQFFLNIQRNKDLQKKLRTQRPGKSGDKAIKRFQVRNMVDASSQRDLREASVYSSFMLPKLYMKMLYCVSCAIHGRVVRVRNKAGYGFGFHKNSLDCD
ncbi:rps2602, partial [Symbiodinium sp. CCMP2592]